MINIEKTGKRIALLRREKKLSQEQLAEQLHVSAQAISKWETGRSLPETATLPLLSAVLGHSIDSILLPQELALLSAVYTDGNEQQDVTPLVSRFLNRDQLTLTVSDQLFDGLLQSDRIKLLIIKYETPAGIYSTYALTGQQLALDVHTGGYPLGVPGLTLVHAAYGNELDSRDMLKKMKHYAYFEWQQFTVDQQLFPGTVGHKGNEYLLLVYRNAEGIQAISCAEGEQLHYNAERTRMFVTSLSRQRYIIDNVQQLGFGKGMDCSWAGALYTALTAMGTATSYEEVMGISGACWRAAFTPVWDYSAADALTAYDYASPAFSAYGLKARWADRLSAEERRLETSAVMESLHNHRLPVAINLRVAPEWGVITGYLDNGNTLLCRSYFDDETFTELRDDPEFRETMKDSSGYLYVDHWPYRLLFLEKSGDNPPAALDNLLASLQIRLDSMQAGEQQGYLLGYNALAAWQEGLLDSAWYTAADEETFTRRYGVNHFCMMALTDARRSAAAYLKASLPLMLNTQAYASLAEMAAIYEQMYTLLDHYFSNMTPPAALQEEPGPKQLWDREDRRQQAELLHETAGLERRGDELAVIILEHLQAE
ncbi:helix-turn-helix domain-containing protein [Paenibacillus sp. FSL R7-0331]|uniref:helix-turn-helix domain-containing protein n=1 Tax=Paenibacillus sp. FSL R7-0331 TaxID=1536773 RepID=UPI000694F81C|nr:helix-turn-helix transcriptional regulator [Paenibacillus sp. FSL R7-0331]